MRNLISFLLRKSSWFIFLFLELICFYLIFNKDSYQKSVLLNSTNEISGRIYTISGNIVSYFGLREENETLLLENANLQAQLKTLRSAVSDMEDKAQPIDAFVIDTVKYKSNYELILSRVVNNSISKELNFITINKGLNDGVKEDMGVISHLGIVGIVRKVSAKYAVVQPVLNPNSKFSCKVLNSNTPGTLVWNGGDPRYANLMDYPKFEKIEKGDSIVTSGFSEIFPEGIFVGLVTGYESQTDDNFYSLEVRLSTDFSSLKNVIVLKNTEQEEKTQLENQVRKNVQ